MIDDKGAKMIQNYRGIVLFAIFLLCHVSISTIHARELSFEDRVAAQEAIARISYSHQIGASRPFEEALSRDVLEGRVRAYLRQTVALEQFWSTHVTKELLQQEMSRIESSTRMPGRLKQIYAALGNDPQIIMECLVRPIVTDRLSRELFAFDMTIHAGTRRRAERLHAHLTRREISAYTEHPDRYVSYFWKADGKWHDDRSHWHARFGSTKRPEELSGRIEPMDMVRMSQSLPQRVGEVGPVREMRDRFLIQVLLEKTPDRLRLATFVINKQDWSEWWETNGEQFAVRKQLVIPGSGAISRPNLLSETSVRDFNDNEQMGAMFADVDGGTGCITNDSWHTIAVDANTPSKRANLAGIWTGNLMIVWGGGDGDVTLHDTGGRYDPVTDSWTPTSTLNAPEHRYFHSAVWTGDLMIVWGGLSGSELNTGGLYDPVTDSWIPTSTVDAPDARSSHSAIWTGAEMIVWGGQSAGSTSGGRYDPSSDEWTPMSSLNQPSGRLFHSTVWTGQQMIVWGGQSTGGTSSQVDTGGRYDPISDLWLPTSTTDVPPARDRHSAVWTGNSMIVWGGLVGSAVVNAGSRYDPLTDSWSSVATLDAPEERMLHSAAWTGSQMIVWGGIHGPLDYVNSGGLYDEATDNWSATTTTNAPGGRVNHVTVWSDDSLLIWGGTDSAPFGELDTGGRYCTCQSSTYFEDTDGDTFGDASSSLDACSQPVGFVTNSDDCNDADGTVWGTPTATQNLLLTDNTTLSWSPPINPGGTTPDYDLLRSDAPSDFGSAATCVQTNSPSTIASDTAVPALGSAFTYLPRAESDCPGGAQGSLGVDSDGIPRTGRTCP